MIRFALALAVSFVVPVAVRAADLPIGSWTANVNSNKGELVIKTVKDKKVAGTLLGTDFTGTWDGKVLTFQLDGDTYEAQLVSELGEKGKTKFTLTGTRFQTREGINRAAPGVHVAKTGGWYAQISAETPVGEIKAEIRGLLVQNGADVYVSVKHKGGSDEEETRIWVWKSEGEWKLLQYTLAPMYGKEVIVTGNIAQLPKGHRTSIPEGALYFLGKFEIKLAGDAKKGPGSTDPSRGKD